MSKKVLSREYVLRKLKERETLRKQEQTTLAQLHDYFEEGEGEEFRGDPMWWRYIEDIDCDRIYNTKEIEYQQVKDMFFETIFYILVVAFVTVYAMNISPSNAYEARQEQLDFWNGCQGRAPDTLKQIRSNAVEECEIQKVVDIQSFWEW